MRMPERMIDRQHHIVQRRMVGLRQVRTEVNIPKIWAHPLDALNLCPAACGVGVPKLPLKYELRVPNRPAF